MLLWLSVTITVLAHCSYKTKNCIDYKYCIYNTALWPVALCTASSIKHPDQPCVKPTSQCWSGGRRSCQSLRSTGCWLLLAVPRPGLSTWPTTTHASSASSSLPSSTSSSNMDTSKWVTHTHTHTHVCMHVNVHTHTSMCARTSTNTHMHTHTHWNT